MKNKLFTMASLVFGTSLLISSSSSLAAQVGNFAGHWVGTGKFTSSFGMKGDCSKVDVTIEQTETALITKVYKADCGLYTTDWGPVQENLHPDGKVFEGADGEEAEVGTITHDTLTTLSPDGQYQYSYNLQLIPGPNGQTILRTHYGAGGGAGAMGTDADLQKVNP